MGLSHSSINPISHLPLLLAVVVLVFAICWLPYHIGRFLFTHVDDYHSARLSQNFNVASMVLFYLSASINPVLYNLMSNKYRSAVKHLFLLSRRGHRGPNRRHVSTHDDTTACTETFNVMKETVMSSAESQEPVPF